MGKTWGKGKTTNNTTAPKKRPPHSQPPSTTSTNKPLGIFFDTSKRLPERP